MKNKILQDILNESLAKNKDKIAIEWGNQGLSYHELETRTHHIANDLIKRGIKPQTFIGILMEDKVQFIQVMLGILKAGCVFVPLDPDLPPHRLEIMIKVADIRLIISDHNRNRWWIDRGIEYLDCRWIRMDEIFSPQEPSWYNDNPGIRRSPEDKIYIYFTSGSTGTPRAMVGKNKSLLHFIRWQINTFGIDETFRCSQLINPMFDAILRDIFVPLCTGGTVCIPDNNDITRDAAKLPDWLEKAGIHLIHCAPALFKVLNSNHLKQDRLKHLKFILLSGERIHPPDIANWYDTFDERIQLVNLWGTSETTLAKTYYFIRKTDINKERIPIGKPMTGAMVVVLDKTMKICGEQVIGDLYIRTPFRTLGYLNEPELTHERFIQNPFSTDPNDLLHVTGDLGVLLTDGNLDIIGRLDRQVKIRGIRIELEEIESVLVKHPAVDEAVVIKKVTPSNEELLCTYITTKQAAPGQERQEVQTETLTVELQDYLKTVLPEYMVPGIILAIDNMPRNANGKIDYDQLPDPLSQREEDYIPPGNPVEKKLMELWQGLLGIEKLSITSHFFNLGGNSLNVMSLISKIHKEFDVRIPLGKIFNFPTIEKQAGIIQEALPDKYSAIPLAEKKEYYELSSAQKRLYIVQQMEIDNTSYNIPIVVVMVGGVKKERLEDIFLKLIQRHENLRTSFVMIGSKVVQKIYEEIDFKIEYYETSEEDAKKIVNEFVRPFDLSKELLRVGLIKIDGKKRIFMVDMHHIISDGVTMNIIIKEFMALYGGNEQLPPLKVQYKDYSEWQNNCTQSERINAQKEYWLKQFAGEIPVLDFPTDYPRPTVLNSEGDQVRFRLDRELANKIKRLEAEAQVTCNIVLLSIFYILLSKYTGQEDIVVGTPITGRSDVDLQYIVGMFVNTLPLRNKPESHKTFGEFLEEVKESAFNGYENQDYQFDELVVQLGLQGNPHRNPLINTTFTFQNSGKQKLEIPDVPIKDLKLHSYKYEIGKAKFDLTLDAAENNGSITMLLRYLTILFKKETIEKIQEYYIEILEQVVENNTVKLKDITLSHDFLTVSSTVYKDDGSDFKL
jgi:amino acid adenylation domain-containing protein